MRSIFICWATTTDGNKGHYGVDQNAGCSQKREAEHHDGDCDQGLVLQALDGDRQAVGDGAGLIDDLKVTSDQGYKENC